MKEAVIVATIHQPNSGLNYYYVTYEWSGPKTGIALIDYKIVEDGMLDKLPWPVHVFPDPVDFMRYYQIVRKDVGWGLWWRLARIKRWVQYKILWFKVRMVMTSVTWGVGYWPEGTRVSWRYMFNKNKEGR